jgi:precorrin-6A/cobalt-precorrin-6A reductase
MRVLLLGGTSEASKLARLLAGARNIECLMSFAGHTKTPLAPPVPFRVGGFGGVEGLISFLEAQQIDILVDATHPFAEVMSRNAALAAAAVQIPLIKLSRPAWAEEAGDRWIRVPDMAAAVAALGEKPAHVFLTIGRLQLAAFQAAPQHFYLIRTINAADPMPKFPHCRVIAGIGPFSLEDEEKLLREERIDILVTKNSGGDATYAKILAARRLGLPVVLVERPQTTGATPLHDPAEALDFILRQEQSERRAAYR